jgi:hypothetical protein
VGATELRRTFGWAIVAGLCLAAAVAVVALLNGEFDDTDAQIVATSLGFSLFTAIGAPGIALARRGGSLRPAGIAAAAAAAIAYGLLLVALWAEDDDLWQPWGVAAVIALGLSHASLVTAGRRRSDTPAIAALVSASIALGAVDAAAGALTIAEVFEDIDEGWVRVLGVTLVLLLLTTVLPPIMRRLDRRPGAPTAAADLEAIADRLEGAPSRSELDAIAADLRRLARERPDAS